MLAVPSWLWVERLLQPRAGLLDAGVVVVAVLRNLRTVVAAVLSDGSVVAGAVLGNQGHQVAALLQDVGFLIAARLHDSSQQRLTVLRQQGDVGLADLVEQSLLAHRWWQLAEIGSGCQVIVFHQVVGTYACAAAQQEQAKQGSSRRVHGVIPRRDIGPTGPAAIAGWWALVIAR
jgi:hypothetical protein